MQQQKSVYCSQCPPQILPPPNLAGVNREGLKAGEQQGLGLLRKLPRDGEGPLFCMQINHRSWRYRFLLMLAGANMRNIQQIMPGLEFSFHSHRGPTATRKHALMRARDATSICRSPAQLRCNQSARTVGFTGGERSRLSGSRAGDIPGWHFNPDQEGWNAPPNLCHINATASTFLMTLTSWQTPLRGGEQIFPTGG
jgi:hypothetical protein